MPTAIASEVVEQAWRERPGLPASHSCGGPVSVRRAVSWCAGDGVRGFAAVGGAVQLRGAQRSLTP